VGPISWDWSTLELAAQVFGSTVDFLEKSGSEGARTLIHPAGILKISMDAEIA
jgi:hypothetical protein